MNSSYSDALGNLVDQLAKLPGIGRKSAQRLAFHILKQSDKEARLLAGAIIEAKEKIHYCRLCYNLTDQRRAQSCLAELHYSITKFGILGHKSTYPDSALGVSL